MCMELVVTLYVVGFIAVVAVAAKQWRSYLEFHSKFDLHKTGR